MQSDYSNPEPKLHTLSCHFLPLEFNKYCYITKYIIIDDTLDLDIHCLRNGGHLTSIHSKEESQYLIKNFLITDRTLIGFKNNSWIDGSNLDYVEWNNTSTLTQDNENICGYIYKNNEFQGWRLDKCPKIGSVDILCKIPQWYDIDFKDKDR